MVIRNIKLEYSYKSEKINKKSHGGSTFVGGTEKQQKSSLCVHPLLTKESAFTLYSLL